MLRKATAPPNAALRCAALRRAVLQLQQTWNSNSANVAPLGAARRVEIVFFGMMTIHGGEFFTTRDSSGYRDWPQSNAEKTAFISRRGTARRSEAQLAV